MPFTLKSFVDVGFFMKCGNLYKTVFLCSSTDKSKEELETINNAAACEFLFCYNVNILLKVHEQNSTLVVPVAGIAGDDKECYRFEVSQTLVCNYDLVNLIPMGSKQHLSVTFWS
jgi:hypothetical protein